MGHNAPPASKNLTEDNLKLQYYILYHIGMRKKNLDSRLHQPEGANGRSISQSINIRNMLQDNGIIAPARKGEGAGRKENNHRRIWEGRQLEKIDNYLSFLAKKNVIDSYEFSKYSEGTHKTQMEKDPYRAKSIKNEEGEYIKREFNFIRINIQ